MKPTWDEAPEWASWLAQQKDGSWWWFEKKPEIYGGVWYTWIKDKSEPYVVAENWKDTLESRQKRQS